MSEPALLHAPHPPSGWANLGLWTDRGEGAPDYAPAAEALARRIAEAAGMQPGDRVLGIACGYGTELTLWHDAFGAREIVGIEREGLAAAEAQRAMERRGLGGSVRVLHGSLDAVALPQGAFDRVVCVDAAYHLSPRRAFLRTALRALRPGGSLAYTDLVIDDAALVPAARRWSRTVRSIASRHGLDLDEIVTFDATVQRLLDLGALDVRVERLDDAVLGGFARFVERQSRAIGWRRFSPAWWRVAATAAWLPRLRRRGLGYALFSARAPLGSATASAARRGG